jgi:hypothetical protein
MGWLVHGLDWYWAGLFICCAVHSTRWTCAGSNKSCSGLGIYWYDHGLLWQEQDCPRAELPIGWSGLDKYWAGFGLVWLWKGLHIRWPGNYQGWPWSGLDMGSAEPWTELIIGFGWPWPGLSWAQLAIGLAAHWLSWPGFRLGIVCSGQWSAGNELGWAWSGLIMGYGERGLARDGLSWARTGLNKCWSGRGSAGHGLVWTCAGLLMGCAGHGFGLPCAGVNMDKLAVAWNGNFKFWNFRNLVISKF